MHGCAGLGWEDTASIVGLRARRAGQTTNNKRQQGTISKCIKART